MTCAASDWLAGEKGGDYISQARSSIGAEPCPQLAAVLLWIRLHQREGGRGGGREGEAEGGREGGLRWNRRREGDACCPPARLYPLCRRDVPC